jgi:hypothetical protein
MACALHPSLRDTPAGAAIMEQRMLMAAEADSEELRRCIDACERCHRVCLHAAMTQCLEQGGEHLEPPHFRVMLACAELCRTTADAMLAGYALYEEVCAVCARVCRDCAESCERVGELEECADACRRCAASCARITGAAGA